MIFRKAKRPSHDPELAARREKILKDLESDLNVMGWDKPAKYYHVLDYQGENVVVLRDTISDKPISFLVGRRLALGADPSVIGCVLSFEGYTYPPGITEKNSGGLPPGKHPQRLVTRVLHAEFRDGMSIAIQRFEGADDVAVMNNAYSSKEDLHRGPLVEALRYNLGVVEVPDKSVQEAAAQEMRSFIQDGIKRGLAGLAGPHAEGLTRLYAELTQLINRNASDQEMETCIRKFAKELDMAEEELVALAKFVGLF